MLHAVSSGEMHWDCFRFVLLIVSLCDWMLGLVCVLSFARNAERHVEEKSGSPRPAYS